MQTKGLTYDELMELALKHYNKGGDQTYECWAKSDYEEYVKLFGPITRRDALEMFRLANAVYRDVAATAW